MYVSKIIFKMFYGKKKVTNFFQQIFQFFINNFLK